ncbi:branched-chain amino acid transport system ATP-binding protein [Azospirillum fermentarium]|uniref:ATP-binding cassette domain-containing protein n=1 Tax=Azospirillum fermentarium TaxID=1233114 RepID=UPI0029CAB694|nr:ATP-binding cassette domain-containing protein [Azospirillum fermentarium]MCW2248491.1 branched-chain amino acid transport system ATP-binding protein [Azospirillum fermentarium]
MSLIEKPEAAPMLALTAITDEHRNLWRLTVTLEAVADDIAAGAAVDPAFFAAAFDYIDQFMDGCHHAKEDGHLFPAVRRRTQDADAAIDRLQAEHRNGPAVLAALRPRFAGPHPDGEALAALRTYTQTLRAHIATEEKEVMPIARAALTAEDWAEIDHAFSDHHDPVFGTAAREEFRDLYHRIASLAPDSVGLGTAGVPAADTHDVLLRITGLESSYGRIKALKGIDLEVRRGELVALVGANGAGKTTFLRALSGVQPIGAGRITFDGEDISRLRADLRVRRGICQSPEGRQVFGTLSIEDNLRLGAFTRSPADAEPDLRRVYAMFPVLEEKRRLPAGTLSGGQQQMLAIGRALMGRPKLLLLDEPSMGLAPLLVQEVFNVIRRLKDEGMTILLVEQNAFAALAIADRGYVLETGAVTLTGSGQDLIGNEQVRSAYLGM